MAAAKTPAEPQTNAQIVNEAPIGFWSDIAAEVRKELRPPVSGFFAAAPNAPVKGVLQGNKLVLTSTLAGDMDGNNELNTNDAVYLLLHVMFDEEDYPIADGAFTDVNGSGTVNTDDAVYLLLHVMFGAEDYPIAA